MLNVNLDDNDNRIVRRDKNTEAFFELVKAGLFGHTDTTESTDMFSWDDVDWGEVYRLAEEQSVVGLVAAGIDTVNGSWLKVHGSPLVPQKWALQFIGQTLQIEQRNKVMNAFVAELIEKLRRDDIYAILVKGQGVAQCYDKPLWRSSGDVDLLLSDDNYRKAKEYLLPKASFVEDEEVHKKHLAMTIGEWTVELHGSLRCGFSSKIDKELNKIYNDAFYGGNVRSWLNGNVQVFLLGKENDVLYVFAHFINHFYKGGVGLRQICDWCRLLWTYKDSLNHGHLESWIRKAGLISEWKAFGALAIDYLGFPKDSMPLLNDNANANDNLNANLKRKADRIMDFILKSGNMGHNRDSGFKENGSYLKRKVRSFGQRMGDLANHIMIFPIDTLRFFPSIVLNGIRQK